MNPIQDTFLLFTQERPRFFPPKSNISPYSLLFHCEQQITWALQVAGLYQWKDRNVEVRSLNDDDKPSTTTTKKPALSVCPNPWKLPDFPFRIFTEVVIYLFASARWIDLSSSTSIQINKNDFLFMIVVCHILVLILKQCCVLLTSIAITCYSDTLWVAQGIEAEFVVSTNTRNTAFRRKWVSHFSNWPINKLFEHALCSNVRNLTLYTFGINL